MGIGNYLHKAIVFILLFLPVILQAQITDNTAAEKKHATQIHIVAKGETLIGIAKRSHCTIAQITQLNPTVTDKTLKYGSKIIIPVINNALLNNTGSAMVKKTLTETPVSTGVEGAPVFSPTYHIVKKGETLSAIAVGCHQKISDLKQWNHLTTSNLEAGKKIIVGETIESVPNNYTVQGDLVETTQNGIAKWETDTLPAATGAFLCGLCSDVPVGSIVKVTNVMNDENILVKITGKLSANDEDESVLIRISESAARQLNAPDEKIIIKLSYFLPAQLSLK